MRELKVVIDTNVLVSILKGSRRLSLIYSSFKAETFKLAISAEILKELAEILFLPRLKIDPNDVKELFLLIRMKALRVKPRVQCVSACRDPKDNFILEAAVEAKADIIVTGDKDLLELSPFRDISIITPREFINRLKK